MFQLVERKPHSIAPSKMTSKGSNFFQSILQDVLRETLREHLKKYIGKQALLFGGQFVLSKVAILLLRRVPAKILPRTIVGPAGILIGSVILLIPDEVIDRLFSRPIERVQVMVEEKVNQAKNNSPDKKRPWWKKPKAASTKKRKPASGGALSLFNPEKGKLSRSFAKKTTKRRSSAGNKWLKDISGLVSLRWDNFSFQIPTQLAGVFMALGEKWLVKAIEPSKNEDAEEPIKPEIINRRFNEEW